MAWPSDRTLQLNEIFAGTFHALIPFQYNLLTQADEKLFRVASIRDAFDFHQGGDEFRVNAIIKGGDASQEYDPADENPSITFNTTGEQSISTAHYKMWAREKQMNIASKTLELNAGAQKVADIFSTKIKANVMKMMEEFVNNAQTPGGFWYQVGGLPSAELCNAQALFVSQTLDFAEVDVSTYTKFKPSTVAASDSNAPNLISQDLTALLNACDYDSEGYPTDIFTNQTVWEKIIALKAAKNVASMDPASVDFGARSTTMHAGVPVHWSRHIGDTNTYWNNNSDTTGSHPIIAIDFSSLRLRLQRGGTMPGDEYAIIRREGPFFLQPSSPFYSQRMTSTAQWYFSTSRRTSGSLSNILDVTG